MTDSTTCDGVTPTVIDALRKIAHGPVHCHELPIFARGRMVKLGLATKVMLMAPFDGIAGCQRNQLHYEITNDGKRVLGSCNK